MIAASAAVTAGQQKDPSASGAWVRLPAPGETTATAFVAIDNPTMYDIYLASASADVAGKVEFRQADASGALKPGAIKDVTVPAYGSLEMDPKGVQIVLSELKRPLKEGDTDGLDPVRRRATRASDGQAAIDLPRPTARSSRRTRLRRTRTGDRRMLA
jgi:copper(I)-binding protein